MRNICKVEDCGKFVHGDGYCGKHYMRIRNHGTLDIECIGQSRIGTHNGFYGVRRLSEDNPFFGKEHTQEIIERMKQARLGMKLSEEHKQKISVSLKGRIPYWLIGKPLSEERKQKTNWLKGENSPHWKGGQIERVCEECEEQFRVFPASAKRDRAKFCSRVCSMINRRKRGEFCRNPNKSEQVLIDLFEQNNLPFKYVGNGEVWLGNRNPDFINTNGKKQVIELMGAYWHPLFDGTQRVEHYKQYGFSALIIWEDELADLSKVHKRIIREENNEKEKSYSERFRE